MRQRIAFALLLAFASIVSAAEPPLTNDDVVKLSRAGLSAETIVTKIRAADTAFATDTEALVALANAGVADVVIRAMIEKSGGTPEVPVVPATPKPRRKRIEEVAVATKGGGRCEHATLELTINGAKTTGCHETDVNVAWKDVTSVCYLFSFRSTLVLTTATGERRIHATTPAELKEMQKTIRDFAPAVRETTSCR